MNMPELGFGTFRMPGDDCRAVVESALALGYRHIDTAAMYDNEAAVGQAIKHSGIPRDEVFLTTKVWHNQLAPSALLNAFEMSLDKLAVDYVDLYMVHWPTPEMDLPGMMNALVSLRDSGRAKAIGVCNFTLPMLHQAIDVLGAPIAAVQVEYHPFLDQRRLLDYLRGKGIPMVAYAPLAQGRAATDPVLAQIGARHSATAAQVALAWLRQQGVVAIPKAQRPQSQQANLDSLRVTLDEQDMQAIAQLPKDQRYVQPPFAPQWDAA
ncbi:aldo/keto reductase [Pseudomonas tolaasii]|uniref:aldo/keto reductase n=1 Tax=Pseudomonas tolaasii TaxID=29442 RepID=UPI000311FA8C|nr:aldo/keto reductase [Pseudomonas tolaasii]